MYKAKILALGPCKSGKTAICNFLSDATESMNSEYHSTRGVRILEFEVPNVPIGGGRMSNCEVELWDVSGDTRFENCWPAIARDVHGVMFVFNPGQPHCEKHLQNWYNYFVGQNNLKDSQCVSFAHHKDPNENRDDPRLPKELSKIPCIHTNLDEESEELRSEFQNFLSSILAGIVEKREQEELNIMNDRH